VGIELNQMLPPGVASVLSCYELFHPVPFRHRRTGPIRKGCRYDQVESEKQNWFLVSECYPSRVRAEFARRVGITKMRGINESLNTIR